MLVIYNSNLDHVWIDPELPNLAGEIFEILFKEYNIESLIFSSLPPDYKS